MKMPMSFPPDWQAASVSKYCYVQLGKMLQSEPEGDDDELLPYLRAINIAKSGLDTSHEFSMWIRPREKEKFLLLKGDVLVSEGGDAGRTAHFDIDEPYYFQNAINRIRPQDGSRLLDRYIYYWFTFLKEAGYVELICNVATIPHFTAEKVKAAPLAFPSIEVQSRIVELLDKKTAQIDALIAKKKAMLERLAEKRQALITQAVTKGLNPSAPMKDSGIEWLGQIPAHWEVKRLKYLCDGLLKYGANEAAEYDDIKWPRFIRITDVDESGDLRPETFRSLPPETATPYLLKEGDILLARSGATVGKSFIYRVDWGKACYAGYLIRARILKEYSAEFVYDFLNSSVFWSWISANFIQSTIQNVSAEKYANLWVTCPPKGEQEEISAFVARKMAEISSYEGKVSKSIFTLSEYRSALISAAVTGQIEGLA